VRTGRGSSPIRRLPDEEAVVQSNHIRNHNGSNGPGHRFVMPVAESVCPSIQILEM